MLHHVSVGVGDLSRAITFYDKVLGALGYKRVMTFDGIAAAYGETFPEFWIGRPHDGGTASVGNGVHISFRARNEAGVKAFHDAALDLGGRDDGPPGPRPNYGPNYFGAFARDLDGNKIEAVFHAEAKAQPARKAKAKVKASASKAARPAKAAKATKSAKGKKAAQRVPAKGKATPARGKPRAGSARRAARRPTRRR